MHAEAISVQFQGLDGVLPGFGQQRPNDWGWARAAGRKIAALDGRGQQRADVRPFLVRRARSFNDPAAELAPVVLTSRDFAYWRNLPWPATLMESLREFGATLAQ